MAIFTIEEVCTASGGKITSAACSTFTGISTDTRAIKQGDLFVALAGERFDGHNFIQNAVDQGATGVVIHRPEIQVPAAITVIVVNDTLKALQDLACYHRQRFDIPVIAITGSNGKTTTKDMTAAVLSSRLKVLKTQANFNNEIGLPLTLLNLTGEHEVAVVEMGMRGKREIEELTKIALPNMGIVTNVGETHIELLGSIDNIASAKAELVEAIDASGTVILNADNPYVYAMQEKTSARVRMYGLGDRAQVRADQIETDGQFTTFLCFTPLGNFCANLPAIGKHNVYNALAAISAGIELGLTLTDIRAGLLAFAPSAMRQHVEKIGDFTVINDAYNASPLSMRSAIDTMMEIATGRTIAVLGDMLELGSIAIEAHRQIGLYLAERGVSAVVTVGHLAGEVANAARYNNIKDVICCDNHEEAWQALQRILQPGDTVLVKGSRGMKMEKLVELFHAL